MNIKEETYRIKELMGLITETNCKYCDDRTKKVISTLKPELQSIAKKFVDLVKTKKGLDISIIGGFRPPEEQDKLYCQGRPNDEYCIEKKLPTSGSIVTNAKGGQSNHNFASAFDAYLKTNNQVDLKKLITPEIASIGKALGLEWGGDWKDPYDPPHFQLPENDV